MKPATPAASDGRTLLATWLRDLVRLQPSSGVFAGLERRLVTAEASAPSCP
jgi:hypothetical protein